MTLATLKAVTLGVATALVALMLYAGEPRTLSWWLWGLPFGVWIVGPAILPYGLARRFRAHAWVVNLLGAFLIVSTAWSGVLYYRAFFVSRSSTASLIMIFAPLFQWIALTAVVLIVLLPTWLGSRTRNGR